MGETSVIAPYPASSERDREAMRQVASERRREKIGKLKRRVGKLALGSYLAANIAVGQSYAYIQRDINEGKAELANAHPSVYAIHLTDRPNNQEVATYVATGLGTRNPSETARKLTAHHELGNVFAIEYSNRDINIDELTDAVVENARAHGIKYLFFDGYSMGGPIELAIAAEIYEQHDDLYVLGVTMNSSPVGDGGLTAQSQEAGDAMSGVLGYWPDLVYSKRARLVAEVVARHEHYFDQTTHDFDYDSLEETIRTVKREKIDDKNVASASLIRSQYEVRYRHKIAGNIARLSSPQEGRPLPEITYTRSDDPSTDRVVNVTVSAANFQAMTAEHFVPNRILDIHNVGHANPSERPTEYNEAIYTRMNPSRLSMLRVYFGVGGKPEYGDPYARSIPPKPHPEVLDALPELPQQPRGEE